MLTDIEATGTLASFLYTPLTFVEYDICFLTSAACCLKEKIYIKIVQGFRPEILN